MTYIPPHPPRPNEAYSLWKLLQKGRENLLSIWPASAFEDVSFTAKLLHRHVVVANSPDTVRQAFVTANASFEEKSDLMQRALKPLIGDGLFISHGETWRSRRRIVGSVIHGSRVPGFAPLMIEAMVELREQWTQQLQSVSTSTTPVNMLSEMTKLTADVIARAIFGCQLGKENAQHIAEGFSDYQKNIGVFNLLPLLGLPDSLTYLLTSGIWRSAKRVTSVLDELVANHFKRNNQGTSVLGILSSDTPDGKTLDHQAIRNEAAVIFMAGHETTANCLAWAWFLLSQAPECEKKLHAEIDAILAGRVPTYGDVAKLKYARAIIEETLRLYPPIPILSRQAVKNERLGNHDVPKGAIVAVIPWLLHRHKLFWEKPDHFIPERFLPENPPPDKYSYLPFSIGPRVCAGMAFGLTEAILGLAILSQTLRFQLAPGATIQAVSHLSLRPDDGNGKLPMAMSLRNVNLPPEARCPVRTQRTEKICEYA